MWWRFFPLLMIGFGLSICLSCSQMINQAPQSSASQTEASSPSSIPSSTLHSSPAPLPPATQAILADKQIYNPPRGDLRFVVISDLNSYYGATEYEAEVDTGINLIPFWQPDLVLCSGDMVAGQKPSLTAEQIRAMWTAFDQHIAAPLRRFNLPFGFTVGNHDASSATAIQGGFLFQQERDLAHEYWNQPEHSSGVQFIDRYQFPFYYTFAYKDVFFLVWDGSSNKIPEEKLTWVRQALSSPQAQQSKLRILVGHLPLYAVAVGRNEPGEVMENADELRAMLEQFKVHTYISGHHHAYYPAHKGKMQLLHMGILGSGPRPLIVGDAMPRKSITVLDIKFNSPELTTYTTYDMQTMKPIQFSELPRYLTGHNGMVLRRDVENLNASERTTCEQQLGQSLCSA